MKEGEGIKAKNLISRILSLLLINFILLSLFAPYSIVFASDTNTISIRLENSATQLKAGQDVEVKIYVENESFAGISGYLYYDTDVFDTVAKRNFSPSDEIDNGSYGSWTITYNASNNNYFRIAEDNGDKYQIPGGHIATLTLKVKKDVDTSTVNFTTVEVDGNTDIDGDSGYHEIDKIETKLPSPVQVQPHTVTYNYTENKGESATMSSASVAENSPIDLSVTATKTGYKFVGWNTDKTAQTGLTTLNMGTSDVILYAIFSKEITTTFNYYNGTNKTSTPVVGTIYNNDVQTTVKSPIGSSYTDSEGNTWTKNGWTTAITPSNSPMVAENADVTVDVNKDYYMLYKRNITLHYNINTGESIPPTDGHGIVSVNTADVSTIEGASIVIDSSVPVKKGYTFAGWNTKADGTGNTLSGSQTFAKDTTLYANWTPNEDTRYIVEHYKEQLDGRYTLAETDRLTGRTGTQATARPKTNYTGYTLDTNVSGTVSSGTILGDNSLELKLYYKLDEYDVIFKNEDGTVLSTQKVKHGGAAIAPATPSKPSTNEHSYTFNGWDKAFNNVTSNLEIIATYIETSNKYTVTFYDEDGTTVLGTSSVDYGKAATAPIATKAENNTYTYTFDKWVTTKGGTIEDDLSNVIANRNVYASFIQNYKEYEIEFVDSDGTSINKVTTYHYGDAIVVPANPTKPSTAEKTYTFAGWSEDGTNVIDLSSATVSTNKVYTAVYTETINQYTVTFYDEDGTTVLGTDTVDYGKAATAPTVTKPENDTYTYTFDKWVTTKGGAIEDDLSNVVANRNVYATYVQNYKEYEIEFVDSDGTSINKVTTYHYGDAIIVPANPTKPATAEKTYTFAGWSEDGTNVIDLSSATVSTNKVYTAVYTETINQYTVTFYAEDRTTILDTQTVDYGTAVTFAGTIPTKPATAEKTYTFDKWVDDNGAEVNLNNIQVNIKAYPSYTETTNQYTVTFYDEDGTTVLGTDTVDYGGTAIYPNALPTKASTDGHTYAFDKWVTTKGGTVADDLSNVISARNVYASYSDTIAKYTVRFFNEGVQIGADQTIEHGKAAVEPTPLPTKAADAQYTYTFNGWDKTFNNVTSNLDINARYTSTINRYTVTFYDEDGTTVLKTDTVDYGTAVTSPANPTKPSDAQYTYTFSGWVDSQGGTTPVDLSNIVANTNAYASFTQTINQYTVTFYDEDGTTVLGTDTVDYGAAVTAPSATKPESNGYTYTLDKWVTAQGGTIEDDLSSVIANRDVYATYTRTPKQYTITYENTNGVNNTNPTTYTVEDADITLNNLDNQVGKLFEGWYIDSAYTTKATSIETKKMENIVLYAKWDEYMYTVISDDRFGGKPNVFYLAKNYVDAKGDADVKYDNGNGVESRVYDLEGYLIYTPEGIQEQYYLTDENDNKVNIEYKDFNEAKRYVETELSNGTKYKVYDKNNRVVYEPSNKKIEVQYFVKTDFTDADTQDNTFNDFYDAKKYADKNSKNHVKVFDKNGDIVYIPEEDLYLKSKIYKIGTGKLGETSKEYEDGDTYLYRVTAKTTLETFIKNCETNGTITVYKQDGTVLGPGEFIGTGMTLKDVNKKGTKEISVVLSVIGDTDGNGQVTPTDLADAIQKALGMDNLNVVQKLSADINEDGGITPTDLAEMIKMTLEQ